MVSSEEEHNLRVAFYQLQIDGSRPGLDSGTASSIAANQARVIADMQRLGVEVPPSLNDPEYNLPE